MLVMCVCACVCVCVCWGVIRGMDTDLSLFLLLPLPTSFLCPLPPFSLDPPSFIHRSFYPCSSVIPCPFWLSSPPSPPFTCTRSVTLPVSCESLSFIRTSLTLFPTFLLSPPLLSSPL